MEQEQKSRTYLCRYERVNEDGKTCRVLTKEILGVSEDG